jgi:hypothetical protein
MRSDCQTDAKRSQARRWTWPGALVLTAVLVLASAWPVLAPAAADGQEAAGNLAPARQEPRGRRVASLDDRVTLLSKTLDLDAKQQSELRKVLLAQREETLKAWADETVPAAARVKATELIGQRTADRIRALLNEQQRARYNPPRPPHQAAPGSSRPTVDTWMNPPTAT